MGKSVKEWYNMRREVLDLGAEATHILYHQYDS